MTVCATCVEAERARPCTALVGYWSQAHQNTGGGRIPRCVSHLLNWMPHYIRAPTHGLAKARPRQGNSNARIQFGRTHWTLVMSTTEDREAYFDTQMFIAAATEPADVAQHCTQVQRRTEYGSPGAPAAEARHGSVLEGSCSEDTSVRRCGKIRFFCMRRLCMPSVDIVKVAPVQLRLRRALSQNTFT
jgi:hypothetical protein